MKPRRYDDDDYNDRKPRREERDMLNKYRHKVYDYELDEEIDGDSMFGDDITYEDDEDDDGFEQDTMAMTR